MGENYLVENIEYIAGTCNIGEQEIKQRRRLGYLGVSLTIIGFTIYITGIYFFNLEPLIGSLLFIPAMMGAIGLIQARKKFCAAYGFSKVYNVASDLGLTIKVEDDSAQKKDQKKALIIVIQSFLVSAVIAIVSIAIGIMFSGFIV
jgi:hypothetical protein